jgi:chemotaxis signal transduction protein
MVDLVKIRKKAKEKGKEKGNLSGAPVSSPAPVGATESAGQGAGAPLSTATRLQHFLEHAGERRETRVVREEAPRDRREVLTFVIDREQYAIDIERVVEIVTTRAVTRVPNAEALVVGIISLRGAVVTLLDVRRKLGHPGPAGPSDERRIIVIDHESEPIGFEVDRVLRVVKVDTADIEPHPVAHTSEAHEAIRGVFRHGGALTILLDFAKLLGSRGPVSVFRVGAQG